MDIEIVRSAVPRSTLIKAAENFGDFVKAVIDLNRGIMAIGGELHSDEESILMDDGSQQSDLWGINLYPVESGEDWIEFDSLINIRPLQGNRSRGVEDESLRRELRRIVGSLVLPESEP